MKSYIISLKYPEEKINYLKNFGIHPEYVEGINGKQLSQNDINKNTKSFIGRYCTPLSAIGCALAHIKAWKTFVETTNEPYAIFFEDDVVLEDNFNVVLDKAFCDLPNDCDILYLGCFGCNRLDNQLDIFRIIHYLHAIKHIKISENLDEPSVSLAAHCYVLSRKGAEKLIFYIENNIYQHVDFIIQNLRYKNLIKGYSVNPIIAYQTSTINNNKSMNISSSQPYIITKLMSYIKLNKDTNASYFFNVNIVRIGMFDVSLNSFIFLIGGIICSLYNVSISKATILFFCIIIPDIVLNFNSKQTLFNYILFVLGFFVTSCMRKK